MFFLLAVPKVKMKSLLLVGWISGSGVHPLRFSRNTSADRRRRALEADRAGLSSWHLCCIPQVKLQRAPGSETRFQSGIFPQMMRMAVGLLDEFFSGMSRRMP